ncbi:MAG: orotate phosphoribosyltransferase [Nitrospirae bacterium]|nr:orotate phosphoribosyltransferase [Nitrospirota bacterium]
MIEELIEILTLKSLQVAEEPIFELASGTKSHVYIDCKKTTLTARGQRLIGEILYERIAHLNVDAIGGLTLGADPIASAVALTSEFKGHPIDSFVVRKEPKKHGLRRFIEGSVEKGQKVVIVDDVVTTGQSTVDAITKARAEGLEIVKVIVLVDRQEGGREYIEKQGVSFDAIITKEDLLDAYHKRTDSGRTSSG